jgi:hypothetical protein
MLTVPSWQGQSCSVPVESAVKQSPWRIEAQMRISPCATQVLDHLAQQLAGEPLSLRLLANQAERPADLAADALHWPRRS